MMAMSAHAIVREPGENQQVLEAAVREMRWPGYRHVTMQLERQEMCARNAPLTMPEPAGVGQQPPNLGGVRGASRPR